MKISITAICILLLMAIFAGAFSGVNGECSACKGGSSTTQQDVLNNEWAVFLGKENATAEVMSSTGGLVNPRYNRQNNPSLQSEKSQAPSGKENLNIASSSTNTRSGGFASVLAPLESANNSGIILDISPSSTASLIQNFWVQVAFLSRCPRWRRS
jgi:hypothetical protein